MGNGTAHERAEAPRRETKAAMVCDDQRHCGLTFDMSGSFRLAGNCPLDGGVRRHSSHFSTACQLCTFISS